MIEDIKTNEGEKQLILNGVNIIANNVKVTLGAKGKTVMYLDRLSGRPRVTKDGVTVCRYTYSNNEIENMIIDIVREASEKTVKSSGDGTTTTIIIAQYLINKGIELLNSGMSYYDLAIVMDRVKSLIIKYLEETSIKIDTNNNIERLLDIATVSSNNKEIGEFIYDIIKDISIYGAIEIKNSNSTKDRIEKVKGIKVHKGYYAPQFVNDLVKMQWRHKDVAIVLFNDTIRTYNDIADYVEYVKGKPIIFFVDEIEPTVLSTLITAKKINPNTFNLMFVEHDGFGDRRIEIMNDIAAMTSSIPISSEDGFCPEAIGFAKEIIVDDTTTSILDGKIVVDLVNELVQETTEKLSYDEIEDKDRKYYKRRLATLKGGVAVIYVGATTEVEMKEKKDRIEDAVEAVKAAIDRGVSIGGGYTFLKCYNTIDWNNDEYQVAQCILEPFRQLCINADIAIDSTMEHIVNENKGYDLITNQFYNVEDYKVYDPTGVLIDSLTNAVSVAKSILSIEKCLIPQANLETSFERMIKD